MKKPTRCLSIVLSALAIGLIAVPAASAATIATKKACYAAEGTDGVKIGVTGSGFTPGEDVFAQIPAPGGLAGFVETVVKPDGTISAAIDHVYPGSIDPVAEPMTLQIKGVLSEAILAEYPFQITNLAVATKPSTAHYSTVVEYTFAGFRPNKPIFGHYSRHGHVVLTHKFGKAAGPCGILHTKAKLFPGHGSEGAKYKVQFDDSKKLNPKANPKIVTSLGSIF